MALTKQIEIKGLVNCTSFYIGLFDSNGNAYNFSPTRDSDFIDGIKSTTAELSLNDDLVGSVTVAPPHNYNGFTYAADGGEKRLYDRGLWLDTMLNVYFYVMMGDPEPYSAILTFSNAIDIGNVAIFQDDDKNRRVDGHFLVDLEVKIIGENQSVLASTVYTAEQQSLDYPKEVIATLTPEIPFSAPFAPLNIKPTLPALPKTIKVINKDGRIYIKPKQA